MSLKHPNFNYWHDRILYDKLFYHDIGRELTPEEERFCTKMYHYEEYACGLDGRDEYEDYTLGDDDE